MIGYGARPNGLAPYPSTHKSAGRLTARICRYSRTPSGDLGGNGPGVARNRSGATLNISEFSRRKAPQRLLAEHQLLDLELLLVRLLHRVLLLECRLAGHAWTNLKEIPQMILPPPPCLSSHRIALGWASGVSGRTHPPWQVHAPCASSEWEFPIRPVDTDPSGR
jgi:hypothetical protein